LLIDDDLVTASSDFRERVNPVVVLLRAALFGLKVFSRMQTTMSTIQERPLTVEEISEFEACSSQGLQNLGVNDPSVAPESIVQLVDSYVDKWQSGGFAPRKSLFGRKSPVPDTVDVALGLGAVWGNQIVRRFGWEWTCLQQDGQDFYCVVSQDRGWVIFPTYFIKSCLDNPQVDCTAMLSFNMMMAGSIPENPPHSYENMMDGVHRIVPKR
jgi:hypothetical protein